MPLAAAVVVYAAGVAMTTSATSAYITDLSRRARYGAAHGVFGTIYDIGDALGPIAAGLLVAAVGYACDVPDHGVVGLDDRRGVCRRLARTAGDRAQRA